MKNSIILATSNAGKIKELKALLSDKHCVLQKDLNIQNADETGQTFIENALLKARHASRLANLPAIADDSGLVVPCLNGKPGIYSARFSGENATDEKNIAYLLQLLQEKAPHEKTPRAFFYCAIAYIKHADDPTPLFGTGTLNGHIIFTPKGTHGFGYSPIFYLPEHQCTLSELPLEVRNQISHRGQALKALMAQFSLKK